MSLGWKPHGWVGSFLKSVRFLGGTLAPSCHMTFVMLRCSKKAHDRVHSQVLELPRVQNLSSPCFHPTVTLSYSIRTWTKTPPTSKHRSTQGTKVSSSPHFNLRHLRESAPRLSVATSPSIQFCLCPPVLSPSDTDISSSVLGSMGASPLMIF